MVETEIDGCVALFNPDNGAALFLNETASDLWRLSDGELTIEELIARLAEAYVADPRTLATDIRRTVSDLRDRGFLAPLPG